MYRLILICVFTMLPLIAVAQEDELAEPAAEPRTAKEMIAAAYKISKNAESERELGEVIELLDQALRGDGLTPSQTEYARKLKGWSHNRIGEAFVKLGRDPAALKQFELAVELNENHWKARHNRGVSYAIGGELEKALADFDATIRLNGGYANAWFNRGEIRYKLEELDAALNDYSRALQLDPEDAGFYLARGHVFHQRRAYGNALTDYNRAVQFDPEAAEAYVYRGEAFAELGDYDRAAEDYRRAVQLDNTLGTAYRSIAWLMATCPEERFRETDRALAAAKKAIELDGSDHFQYVQTLAAAYANAGQFEQAQEDQQKAIELAEGQATEDQLQMLRSAMQQYEQQQPYRQERVARRLR